MLGCCALDALATVREKPSGVAIIFDNGIVPSGRRGTAAALERGKTDGDESFGAPSSRLKHRQRLWRRKGQR